MKRQSTAQSKVKNLSLKAGQWNITGEYDDAKFSLTCKNIEETYELHKQFSEIPKEFQMFCDNFSEIVQLLHASPSTKVVNDQIEIQCLIGKLKKYIKLEMKKRQLSFQEQLDNKNLIIKQERERVSKLNQKVNKLSKQVETLKNKYQAPQKILKKTPLYESSSDSSSF